MNEFIFQNRHRDYERSCERLSVVRDISRSLAKEGIIYFNY